MKILVVFHAQRVKQCAWRTWVGGEHHSTTSTLKQFLRKLQKRDFVMRCKMMSNVLAGYSNLH